MKILDKIPTTKLERTSSLLKAGAKVGVNYLKYYGNKITKEEMKPAKYYTKIMQKIFTTLSKN